MIVAVDFNMGAMENKGLNIFNTKYVLASPATATDTDFDDIESVVGHEYFHNWTGNRVTCRDWFQLSLKEGLTVFRDQEFSMDMAGSARPARSSASTTCACCASASSPRTPARCPPGAPGQLQAINNFYTATVYEKGAEVVRMMQTLVGRDGFAKGMSLYFERHDGQAVTCDDFAQAMADANGSELARTCSSSAGTPGRHAARHRRGLGRAHAHLHALAEQHPAHTRAEREAALRDPGGAGPARPRRHAVALRLEGESADRAPERVLVLEEASAPSPASGEPVPSLLRHFSAPVGCSTASPSRAAGAAGPRQRPLQPLGSRPAPRAHRITAAAGWPRAAPRRRLRRGHARRAARRDAGPAFKELVLTPPSETYVAEQLDHVDPQRAARGARGDGAAAARTALRADWEWAWETHQVRRPTPDRRRPDGARWPTWRWPCCAWPRTRGDVSGPARPTSASRTPAT
jgi:aminopeptidase N